MNLTLYPRTKAGVFSITFMIMAVILLVVVAYLGSEITQEGGFFDQMNLALMTIAAFAFSIVSIVTGILAIIRDDERSILCIGSMLISIAAVLIGIAQFTGEVNILYPQTK